MYNLGDGDARFVEIVDSTYDPDTFKTVNGTSSTKSEFDVIHPGESVFLSFEIIPIRAGVHALPPAVVSYRASDGQEKTRGTSNKIERIRCVPEMDAILEGIIGFGAYMTLGFARTAEDWTKGLKIIAAVLSCLTLNQILLLLKKLWTVFGRRRAILSLTKAD